jgi:hypothetical protein
MMLDLHRLYKKKSDFKPISLYTGKAERTVWWFATGSLNNYKPTKKVPTSGEIGSFDSFRFIESTEEE